MLVAVSSSRAASALRSSIFLPPFHRDKSHSAHAEKHFVHFFARVFSPAARSIFFFKRIAHRRIAGAIARSAVRPLGAARFELGKACKTSIERFESVRHLHFSFSKMFNSSGN